MKQQITTIAAVSIVFFLTASAWAEVPDLPQLTPQNFDREYNRVMNTYEQIMANHSRRTIRRIKQARGYHHIRLTKEEASLRPVYLKIVKQKKELQPYHDLRESLINLYLEHNGTTGFDRDKLEEEANVLAITLVNQTYVLKKKYKSIFIPILHNMMIDVGIRKRGACKHWAEDLLAQLRPLERNFYYLAWGEANVGTIMEHNVAVVIPRGRPFEDGLLYDPWRTSGKPFWVRVSDDHHYNWSRWSGWIDSKYFSHAPTVNEAN